MSPLRLGVVSYLNAAPTVHGLAGDPRFEIVRDVPSRIAALLHAGEIDLGLIPSIEYAEGDYAIVPGIAIASRGPVRSVMLLHRGPLEGIRRVAVDTSSRTSAALVRVLLRERLGPRPGVRAHAARRADHARTARTPPSSSATPRCTTTASAARLDLGAEWTGTHRTALRVRVLGGAAGRGHRRTTCARLQAALAAGLARGRPDRVVL